MADRSIVAKLRADISDLTGKLRQVQTQLRQTGQVGSQANSALAASALKEADAEKIRQAAVASAAAAEIRSSETQKLAAARYGGVTAAVNKHRDSLQTLGHGFTVAGAAAALGLGVIVKTTATFDKAMSGVAATGSDAQQNLGDLRDAAIKAGAATQYSATEAADGITNLLKAGVDAKDVLGGGLAGALNLAAAGQISVGDAAEDAANAMTQFKLQGKDVPHIADLLAQGAGTASGEVSDMAQALNQSGLVAHQFGLSVDDTTTTLALFAKNGLIGSDAGTSFKQMLLSLANPSKQAADTMKQLGINAYDAQGKFVGITDLAQQLHDRLGGLSEAQRNAALATIFGTDAIRSASILYDKGAAGVRGMADAMAAYGSAADVAAKQNDNLVGDLQNLQGAFETGLIQAGSGANDALRGIVQSVTSVVQVFDSLPNSVQEIGTVGLALSAMSGLGVGALAKVVTTVSSARTALIDLGLTATATSRVMRIAAVGIPVVGIALAAVSTAVEYFSKRSEEGKAAAANFESALDGMTGKIDQNTAALNSNVRAAAAKTLQDNGSLDAAQRLGLSLSTITDASLGNAQAIDTVNAATQGAVAGRDLYNKASNDSYVAAVKLSQGLNLTAHAEIDQIGKHNQLAAASEQSASSTQKLTGAAADGLTKLKGMASNAATAGGAVQSMGQDSQTAAQQLQSLATQIFQAGNAALSLSNAQLGFRQSVTQATQAAKENGKRLSENTAKGQANRQALNGLASSGIAYVQQLIQQGKSSKQVQAATEGVRDSFIRVARQMGFTKGQAADLAKQFGLQPKKVATQVSAPGADESKNKAKALLDQIQKLPHSQQVKVLTALDRGGIDAAQRALNNLPRSKTITVHTAYITTGSAPAARSTKTRGISANASGGFISGPGGPTSDSIPAWLSNGEFVVRAAAVKAVGVSELHRINSMGYAQGGAVGFAAGGSVDLSAAVRLIAALVDPVRNIGNAAAAVSKAAAALRNANNDIRGPRNRLATATKSYDRAVDARNNLRSDHAGDVKKSKDRIAVLEKQAKATKGNTAADKALARERAHLSKIDREYSADSRKASDRVTAAEKAKKAATDAYNKVADKSKAAAQKLKDAQDALAQSNQALADSAKQTSAAMAEQYQSKTADVGDWLAVRKEGAAELIKFNKEIIALRNAGLNESDVQQLVSLEQSNPAAAEDVISQINKGGKKTITDLNSAAAALQKAADAIGLTAAKGVQRKAGGGLIYGSGTGTSDTVPLWSSAGEFVQPKAAVDHYGVPFMQAVQSMRFAPAQVAATPIHHDHGTIVNIDEMNGGDPFAVAKAIDNRRRDAMAAAGLTGAFV